MRKLYKAYGSEVVFLFVALQGDRHALPDALQRAYEEGGLTTDDETNHCSRLRLGVQVLDLPFPTVVDTPDRKVERLYDAQPERLVIVGGDGRVVLDAGTGMTAGGNEPGWDFAVIEAALRRLLSGQAHRSS